MLPALLFYLRNKLVLYPPSGSALNKVWKIVGLAFKNSKGAFWKADFFESAKPSVLARNGITTFNGKPISWNDKDVSDVQRTLIACGIFLYFPVYNLNDGGIGSVSTSQGSTMTTNGAPNDLLNNFNPLTIIIVIPILSHVIYPFLARRKIKFGRISRITFGFCLAIASGIIGTIIQWRICEYQLAARFTERVLTNGTHSQTKHPLAVTRPQTAPRPTAQSPPSLSGGNCQTTH